MAGHARNDPTGGPAVRYEGLGLARAVLMWVFIAVAIWYLAWRPSTFNPDHMIFSVTLYAAELFGFVAALMHIFTCWRLTVRETPQAPQGLSVDVFVTTYNEPVEMLRRTLLAAKHMSYPHQTWLLDDGNRGEMRRLAREIDVRYIARIRNVDAKAGNLNNALMFSRARFVAVFDADHAPTKTFLTETLGHFDDERVGFVQTPEDFYNLDSYQHRRAKGRRLIWTEQSLFFRVIQRGKDYWNAALFRGSCAVMRRDALDQIRGFATGTVTEDLHTSIRFHKAGWRSVYHANSLAFGLAPGNVVPFLKQRMRWGQGAMQVWRRERIVLSRHLTIAQKINYLATILAYFDGWTKGLFYLAPVIVLTTAAMPIVALDGAFLLHLIPFYLLSFWACEELGRGYARTLQIEQYNMARFAAFIGATFGLFKGHVRLKVPSKEFGPAGHSRRFVIPQYLVLLLNVVAIPLGIALFAVAQQLPFGALAASVIWASLNAGLAALVLSFTARTASFRRKEYRFPVPVPVRLRFAPDGPMLGIFDDVSSSGFKFYGPFPQRLGIGSRFSGELFLPGGPLPFTAVVRAEIRAGDGKHIKGIGCSLEWNDALERDALDQYLYGTDLQWQINDLGEQARTPMAWLAQLSTGRRAPVEPAAHWAPVLYHDAYHSISAPQIGFVSMPQDERSPRRLATMKALDPRMPMRFRVITRTGSQALDGRPVPYKRVETSASPVFLYQFAT